MTHGWSRWCEGSLDQKLGCGRRQGRKLLRVNDFLRVTELESAMLPGLEQLATVYSGRTGIAPEQALLALWQHLFGPEERAVLVERMAPELVSPGTVVNQRVVGNGSSVTVHFGGPVQILALW